VSSLLLVGSIAVFLDLFLGDPDYRFHPVRLMGNYFSFLEAVVYKEGKKSALFIRGVIYFFLAVFGVVAVPSFLFYCAALAPDEVSSFLALVLGVYLLYSVIALRDMYTHIKRIFGSLKAADIERARVELGRIVSRDTAGLDQSGIIRGGVESVAENFSDGFFAPLFYFYAGGVAGGLLAYDPLNAGVLAAVFYRAVNTLDAMVGYRSTRYIYFGKFSARIDDLVNLIPARLAIPFMFAGGGVCGYNVFNGLRVFFKDRYRLPSPNAGLAIAFMAGALKIKLGGPASYHGKIVGKPSIGDGSDSVEIENLTGAWKVVLYAGWIAVFTFSMALIFFFSP